ncbi:MAG: hypothetical protein Q7S63_01820 [bacterium]|nr:hypothetical protein [bacterium]
MVVVVTGQVNLEIIPPEDAEGLHRAVFTISGTSELVTERIKQGIWWFFVPEARVLVEVGTNQDIMISFSHKNELEASYFIRKFLREIEKSLRSNFSSEIESLLKNFISPTNGWSRGQMSFRIKERV